MTNISVFGLGYVGCVSLACLAENGHNVVGVDVNTTKVDMINEGRSPVIEAGLDELIHKGLTAGRIHATTQPKEAVDASQISFICVGTPGRSNGSLNLDHVFKVSEEIGACLKDKKDYHLIVVRSTMLPGSTEKVVIPNLEHSSGRRHRRDFGVCYNPEFLREGSSIKDFYDPPFTVIGAMDDQSAQTVQELYAPLNAPIFKVPVHVAEMVKYTCNAYHALKITFANEIGNLCKEQDIDSRQVMEIFCSDNKLNISTAYLNPGFAFGGSCLPKDLRALLYQARHFDVSAPLLDAILTSNQQQIDMAYNMVAESGYKRVGILGFSFKAGTDDLRESPMVELVERLIGKGFLVSVYDPCVSLANLQGANREYIQREIPHIASLMCSSTEEVVAQSDVILIGNRTMEFAEALKATRVEQKVIDLVSIFNGHVPIKAQYEGICW